MLLADNLNQLLDILPEFISKPLRTTEMRTQLIEIVLLAAALKRVLQLALNIYLTKQSFGKI